MNTVEQIKRSWKSFYPSDRRRKGIVCPLCGNGSGRKDKDGDGVGVTENPKSKTDPKTLHCFGCGFSGSVIELYMQEHGMNPDNKTDLERAVSEMADKLGIKQESPLKGPEPKPQLQITGETEPVNYHDYIVTCMNNLAGSFVAQDYLKRRGISLQTAIADYVGFDPAWISPTVIRKMEAEGKTWRPAPTPRIICPSSETHYVARDISPNADKQHCKMNEGAAAISYLEKTFSGDSEFVFVTEGPFDAMSFHEVGAAAVALNSTSNYKKLIEYLTEHPTEATLVICLDNDDAGKKAAAELEAGLQRLNISSIRGNSIFAKYKDANDALTADRAAFEGAIQDLMLGKGARPDNTADYIENLMAGDIERFKQAAARTTGFANLDVAAGGVNAGLYVLAAISSLGKTTFALQIADQMAAAGQEVLFFSMEQSRLEMVSKSLARMTALANMNTAVSSIDIRRGNLTPAVMAAARTYTANVGRRMNIVEGNFNCDVGYIRDYVKQHMQRTKTEPIVFIDYLQIVQPAAEGKAHNSKREEVELTVTELKRMSRDLNIPVIAICSLNRANYMTPLAFESLKESGQIEYTADVVWGLQLQCLDEDLFCKEKDIKAKRERIEECKRETPRKIKFVCLKNRYGVSGFDCMFEYFPQYDYFREGGAGR